MAQVDEQAAVEELKKVSRLKARAEELVEIAGELQEEAERREHDAQELIAPGRISTRDAT